MRSILAGCDTVIHLAAATGKAAKEVLPNAQMCMAQKRLIPGLPKSRCTEFSLCFYDCG